MQEQLSSLVERIRQPSVKETVRRLFTDLTRLLGYLSLIETNLEHQDSLDQAIGFFSAVHGETLVMLSFIDEQTMCACQSPMLPGTLESISFAIRHELRRVFEHELVGVNGERDSASSRIQITNSYDALQNCFQQSTAILAYLFDPTIKDDDLFQGISVRRRKTYLLHEDLCSLLRITKHVEDDDSPQALALFSERLTDFQASSMSYLMQKDWKIYEDFIDEFKSLRSEAERKRFFNRFGCYLEVLLNHVRMRSAIASN